MAFLSYASVKVYLRSRKAAEVNKMANQEMAALENKKIEMEALINRLKTESGAEEEIRNKFMLKKPGENMVVIVDEEPKIGDKAEEDVSSGLFSKIRHFLKSIFK